MSKITKIGIITSGGDAPGMNTFISSIVKTAIHNNIEPYFVFDGYIGLINKNIKKATYDDVDMISNRSGTIIGTVRFPEFQEETVRKQAINNLKELAIEALVVIGGDGTYAGAMKLSKAGIKCIALPGTIDNDIASSPYTIGFDSCLNALTEYVDCIRQTANSHHRCMIVETMGHGCGDLAAMTALACHANIVSTKEKELTISEIANFAKSFKDQNHKNCLIIVSEFIYDLADLAKQVGKVSGYDTRANRVGHYQRGVFPSNLDRVIATSMSAEAIKLLMDGKTNLCLGYFFNEIKAIDIQEALTMKTNKKNLDTIYKSLDLIGTKFKK